MSSTLCIPHLWWCTRVLTSHLDCCDCMSLLPALCTCSRCASSMLKVEAASAASHHVHAMSSVLHILLILHTAMGSAVNHGVRCATVWASQSFGHGTWHRTCSYAKAAVALTSIASARSCHAQLHNGVVKHNSATHQSPSLSPLTMLVLCVHLTVRHLPCSFTPALPLRP